MSCGKPHATDCSEVLLKVYNYLDGELGPQDCVRIQEHLEECRACLQEYDLDQMLKTLVRRSCVCESAPTQLRMQIMARITTVTIELHD